MKKFIITAMCAAVAFCSIPFVACSDNTADSNSGLIDASESSSDTVIETFDNTENNSAQLTNLENYEVGDSLPVYPTCEFDYKVSDDCVVHISEIKAVLTAKNEINEGDLIEGDWYPYIVTITTTGYIIQNDTTKNPYIVFIPLPAATSGYGIKITQQVNDLFNVDVEVDTYDVSVIYFARIILV
ncbi:MAG: hypothetical protein LUI60_07910 [Clostridia bacterium]|nr:hypothetical protein [Clostridia bacterium]